MTDTAISRIVDCALATDFAVRAAGGQGGCDEFGNTQRGIMGGEDRSGQIRPSSRIGVDGRSTFESGKNLRLLSDSTAYTCL